MNAKGAKISSGNPFLDQIIEGGFILGSIVLIIEDTPSKLYEYLFKYSIAEGAVNKQKVYFYYSSKMCYDSIINNLPYKSSQVKAILKVKSNQNEPEMKIAWRYENIQYANAALNMAKNLEYIFDLSRNLEDKYIKDDIIVSKEINLNEIKKNPLSIIIEHFIDDYQKYAENFTDKDKDNYTRVIIPNLFQYYYYNENLSDINEINTSLINFKAVVRSLNGFAMISINRNILNKKIVKLIENISDYIISIKSLLMVSEKERVGDYQGILYVEKRPSLYSLKPLTIDTDMYGILREKRKIVIENIDIGVEGDRNTKVKDNDIETNKKNIKKEIDYNF